MSVRRSRHTKLPEEYPRKFGPPCDAEKAAPCLSGALASGWPSVLLPYLLQRVRYDLLIVFTAPAFFNGGFQEWWLSGNPVLNSIFHNERQRSYPPKWPTQWVTNYIGAPHFCGPVPLMLQRFDRLARVVLLVQVRAISSQLGTIAQEVTPCATH